MVDLEYTSRINRRNSFRSWPYEDKIHHQDLITAGFYYLGMNDRVKCYYCKGILNNWEAGDHPLVEHARWFSHCKHLKQLVGDDFIEVVKELYYHTNRHQVTLACVLAKLELPIHLLRVRMNNFYNKLTDHEILPQFLREHHD